MTCENPRVGEIDALLAAGSSVRSVARMYRVARSSLARHKEHAIEPAGRPVLVPAPPPEDPRVDPMQAALRLFQDASTSRQRLHAAQAIRGATRLALRNVDTLDDEQLARLDENVRLAESLFTTSPNYEEALRALAGLRAALSQKFHALRGRDWFEVSSSFGFAGYNDDGSRGPVLSQSNGASMKLPAALYWAHVPSAYRDPEKYYVQRSIELQWDGGPAPEEIRVREVGTGALAWTTKRGKS